LWHPSACSSRSLSGSWAPRRTRSGASASARKRQNRRAGRGRQPRRRIETLVTATTRIAFPRLPLFAAAFLVAGCGGAPLSQISLMPAPDVYEEGKIDPFLDNDPISRGHQPMVLYATDRAPAGPDAEDERYIDERGGALRLGVAHIRLGLDESI